MYKIWNDKEIQFVKENYKKMTNKEMAEKLGRTKVAVDIKINKLGLKKSKYSYDNEYFKEINSIEKAYWLGFVYADGYISISRNGYGKEFAIELQGSDYKHLKKFNKSINGNIEVKRFKTKCNLNNKIYDSCSIRIYSKDFVNNLIKQGVTTNKSYSIKLPDIDDIYMSHFIRGYFDGDGCICESKRKKHTNTIKCDFTCGCEEFLLQLRKYLLNVGVNSYMIKENNKPYKLVIGGLNNCNRFLEYIYKDASVYLDRKYKKKKDLYKQLNINERVLPL